MMVFGNIEIYIWKVPPANTLFTFRIVTTNVDGVDGYVESPTGLVSLNTWCFAVFVITNSSINLYLNGVLRGTLLTSNTSEGVFYGIDTLTIGTGSNYGFGGNLADIRIYNKELSLAEITTLYNVIPPASITWNINFPQSRSIIVNGTSKTASGAYTISVSNTASSVLPTLLTSTATRTITIKYPTQSYTQSSYNYKKDGFLKYNAGNQSSSLTRDTGV